MQSFTISSFSLFLLSLVFCGSPAVAQPSTSEDQLRLKARQLAQEFIIVDTHVDVPYRLMSGWEDLSQRTPRGDFDYVRATEGGLNVPFMSIYVPSDREHGGAFYGAKSLADSLIDLVEKFERDWPEKFAVARSVADVRGHFVKGLISLPMGMENGSPIEGKLENLAHFHRRGIRYITLTHAKDNHICDSSYDTTRTWKGLSPFGREVVAEMNRLGIMVDVSHISDDAFFQVMELTKAPVIASHSSCRAFTPGWERNMSDEMVKRLAQNGGVIMINFGSSFLNDDYRRWEEKIWNYVTDNQLRFSDPAVRDFINTYVRDNPPPRVTAAHAADHIDHVVQLVGVDYVGFGSDFDGVGESLPADLRDVSHFPNLIYELLKRGYSDEDIRKICGENLLRVWGNVETVSRRLHSR